MQTQNQTFSQGKLTKSEWNNMEIPVTPDELTIIKLIKDSYHDVQKKYNKNVSMIGVLKTSSYEEMHSHLYKKYFEEIVNEMIKKYKIPTVSSVSVCHSATTTDTIKSKNVKQGQGHGSIKKIDAIRITNNEDGINIKTVYEFTILKICKLLLDKKAMWNKYKQETQDKTVSSKSDNNSRSNSSSDNDSDDDEDNGDRKSVV